MTLVITNGCDVGRYLTLLVDTDPATAENPWLLKSHSYGPYQPLIVIMGRYSFHNSCAEGE